MSAVSNGVICLLCFVTIILLLSCLGCGYSKWKDRTREINININGKEETFTVQNNKDEPEWVRKEVAKRLSRMATKMDKVVLHMYNKNVPDHYVSQRLAERWKKIRSNPKGLRETAFGESSAAYTVNKGEELRICVRDERSDNLFENENDLMFVALHEAAHLMSKSYGHNLEFKRNFAFIAKIAVELGLYNYVDYSRNPTTFCGTDISYAAY